MTEERLRDIFSKLGRVDSGQITWTTPLPRPLVNSLGRARLDAALRSEFGIVNPAIYKVGTFGELCSVLGIDSSSGAVAAAPESASVSPVMARGSGNGLSVGVDVESVKAMPTVLDYWDDDFYKKTFTPREIAFALVQASPQASFAAMWCAKEAVRKANAYLLQADWQRLEVAHDADGKPSLWVDGQPAEGVLSLSHTDEIAIGVFVTYQLRPLTNRVGMLPLLPSVTHSTHSHKGVAVIAMLALLTSIIALAFSFRSH